MLVPESLRLEKKKAAMNPRLGVVLPRDLPVAQIIPFARKAEMLGFDELWVVEDCFFRGGIAQAATVLASTERITVGIGILPAAARNVAFATLEVATLAELHPGRTIVGLGHGVTGWMRQVGAWPASQLTMIEETLVAMRALLRGETVSTDGRYVTLDEVALENPPQPPPLVLAGVRGPKSLAVSGRSADGTILAEPVTPEYAAAARAQATDDPRHVIVAYNIAVVDDDIDSARALARPALEWIGEPENSAHIAPSSYADQFALFRAGSSSRADFAARLPDEWVDDLALVGPPLKVRTRIAELAAAGVDSVVLVSAGPDPLGALDSLARILPEP